MSIKKKRAAPKRLTLRGWAELEEYRRQMKSAAEEGNWSAIPELIFKSIETSVKFDRTSFWMDAVDTYNAVVDINAPTKKFPMLESREKDKPMPWEYPGRTWYFWLNTFALHYGWSEDEIGAMDIDSAIGLYQEILIHQQLENEWEYGLSEMAYPYNPSTKKSSFKPLPRPDWMRGIANRNRPIKKVKIPVAVMPVGNIVNLDEG